MRLLLILWFLFLAGCGYTTPGATDSWVGGEARTVYVQLFENLTSEPYLDHYLTEAIISRLSRSRTLTVTEDESITDLRLTGTVEDFDSNALAYNTIDKITDYRVTMSVTVRLVRNDNRKVVWKNNFRETDDYLATADKNVQLNGHRLSAEAVANRIAEDIYSQLFNTF
jgi:TolB-like protein